jgi:putative flippase GtrA
LKVTAVGFFRWLKFNVVGAAGVVVQLAVLAILTSGLGLHYLVATALAVETAVLLNFYWHERFTWADRRTRARFQRLIAFNSTNGAISIVGNLLLMRLLAGAFGVNYLFANMLSIAACSLANFLVSDRLVFVEETE